MRGKMILSGTLALPFPPERRRSMMTLSFFAPESLIFVIKANLLSVAL